jgi:hypothetical protein
MTIRCPAWSLISMATVWMAAVPSSVLAFQDQNHPHRNVAVMLILRGLANEEHPRGQLDDWAAKEYARRMGFKAEVLDVAGGTRAHNPQARMALDRIHNDETVAAIYGFSAGGYNARQIWKELDAEERERISTVTIVGSPGVRKADFPGNVHVVLKADPPEGHLAGPKALLASLENNYPWPLIRAAPNRSLHSLAPSGQ